MNHAPLAAVSKTGNTAGQRRGVIAVLALYVIGLGVWVGLTSPLMSGGHLIAGPVLILSGGGLLVRIRQRVGDPR